MPHGTGNPTAEPGDQPPAADAPRPPVPPVGLDATWDVPAMAAGGTVDGNAPPGPTPSPVPVALTEPFPVSAGPSSSAVPPTPRPVASPFDLTVDALSPAPSLPPRPASSAGLPETVGEHFRVIEKIGEGGMGVVYKAEQLFPVRRTVAVKVIRVGMDTQEVVARFEAERQALAMMDHPNVARVLDAGMTASGRPYFAMEYVPGVQLVEFCDAQRLTVRQRLELFVLVCQAVQHAHQKGIIHRDLKPTNILVTRGDDGRPVPKVIDFGIAKAIAEPLTDNDLRTRAGALIGTPEYASPEQAVTGGMDVDTRTDVYSLGVILYQLLTGTLPLDARTLRQDGPDGIARILREVEPPRPSTRVGQLRRAPDAAGVGTREAARAASGSKEGGGPPASGAAGAGDETGGVTGGNPTLLPRSGGANDATYHAVVAARRADPRSFLRVLSGDLDWITLKAMDKDRTRRYETAHGLAADVRRYLDDEPVVARPPTTRYRMTKFVRRYKAAVVVSAVMLALLVLGVVGTTTGLVRAVAARGEAMTAKAGAEQARAAAEAAQRAAEAERRRAEEELVLRRAAEALADEETRKSVAQGIVAAEQLVEARKPDAVKLAELARSAAVAALGPDDPLSLAAGDVLGRALLTTGKRDEAERTLRAVVGRARAAAAAAPAAAPADVPADPPAPSHANAWAVVPRGRLFADLADAVRQRPAGGSDDEAVALYREALAVYRSTPGRRSRAQLDAGDRLAQLLRALGRLDESAEAYRQTLADHRAQLAADHPNARAVVDMLGTVLVEAGRYDEALPFVRQQLAHAVATQAGPTEELLQRQVDVADVLLRAGRTEEGAAAAKEALATNRQLRAGSESKSHEVWRQLVLRSGIGSARLWASQTFRGNLWLAVSHGLMQSRSRTMATDEVDWAAARFRLYRWTGDAAAAPATAPAPAAAPAIAPSGTGPAPVFDGDLAAFRKFADPPDGLYLLAVHLPRAGDEPLRAASWVLVTPWKLRLFEPTDLDQKDRKRSMWDAINGEAAGSLDQASLLLLDDGNEKGRLYGARVGQGPNGRSTDFAAIATGTLRLPPGPYRFNLTSDDGARAEMGGRLLVNAWEPRAVQSNVVAVELADRDYPVRIEYFQGVNDYVLRLQMEPLSPRADDLVIAAVGADSSDTRRWLTRQARELEAAERWDDALGYYRRAVETGLDRSEWDQEVQQQAVRGAVRAFAKAGRAAEAAAYLEDVGARLTAADVAAETLLSAARARAAAGEVGRSRELATKALDVARGGQRPDAYRVRELARKAVLVRLGSTLVPYDGGLAGQFFCALDEAMLEDRSLVAALRLATPDDVEWALYRWRSKGETLVARGTAADLTGQRPAAPDSPAAAGPMEPGVYLIHLRLKPPGSAARETAHWLLAAPWESAAYFPDGEGSFDRQTYHLIIDPLRRPAALADLGGLAALDALGAEQVPDGPIHRFAVVARARVRVPAGRYRLTATATDGLRVAVDDRRVINTWPSRQSARQDVADVDLGDLLHGLRVDHYRVGIEDKLWVRLEPLDPAAQALAHRLGRRPRTEKALVAEQNDAISRDAYNASALATRGVIHARAGRPDDAARDFAAAQAAEKADPLQWQHRLALAAMAGDRATFERLAGQYAAQRVDWKQPRDGRDRHSAARTALVLLLDERPPGSTPAENARALAAAMTAATTPSPIGGPPPQALAAMALQELNAGRPARAEELAEAAGPASAAREHVAMCDLLVALARHAAGRKAEAAEAFAAASAEIDSWPTAGDAKRWDVYAGIDWMACKALQARAKAVIEGK